MPQSEYDALLEPSPTQPKSEYDALLAQPAAPSGAGEILKTAGKALLSTLGGFIPKTPLQVAEMATPLTGGIETLISTPSKLADVAFGRKTVAQAFPESQTLVEAEKTPAFSKERFEAGFGILGQLGMAAGLAKGLAPSLRETAFGKTEEPLATETAATKEVIKNASEIPSTERVPSAQVRPGVDEKAPLRQQGQAPEVREKAQVGTQVMPVPQPEQPRIISTAVKSGDTVLRGESLNESHDAIGERAGIAKPTEEQRGFTIQNPDGTTREVFGAEGRKEAATVANAAGQVKPENAGTTELHSQQLAAAVSGTEMPPAAVPQIPEGAKATVKLRTETGEMAEATMDAKQAEGIFTKEKSSYQALLNCLGA